MLFPSSIVAVKLNRKTLVIVLETEIYIYDISNMRLLHVIETTPNPDGTSFALLTPKSTDVSKQQYVPSHLRLPIPTSRIHHPYLLQHPR